MKFENTETFNFKGALRGMRNPYDSWNRSDSEHSVTIEGDLVTDIGKEDMSLAKRLIAAGPEHRKFLRQIFVSVDITAPLYWWKEFDKYQIGVTTNSCSTMHRLASNPITIKSFETDDMDNDLYNDNGNILNGRIRIIETLELLRKMYIETKDKRYWKELVRWLPESWLQKRTVTMNYENVLSICRQRKGHKLTEWRSFIDWAEKLPYANELLFGNEED